MELAVGCGDQKHNQHQGFKNGGHYESIEH